MEKELELKTISTTKNPSFAPFAGTIAELMEQYAGSGNYHVVAFLVDKVLIGKAEAGKLLFADEQTVDKKYLKELRIFNCEKELLLKKIGKVMKLRVIEDNGAGENIETLMCVDDNSKFFGAPYELQDGFVTLREEQRKICLKVPAEEKTERFLATRSYVVADEATGLAGYGYYRYLEITD